MSPAQGRCKDTTGFSGLEADPASVLWGALGFCPVLQLFLWGLEATLPYAPVLPMRKRGPETWGGFPK